MFAAFVVFSSVWIATFGGSPNILFIMSDDIGWGDHSYNCFNKTCDSSNPSMCCPSTPNLDAITKSDNTIVWDRFYVTPVCSPTRAAHLTGRAPHRNCIDTAEGCGQQPSWICHASRPLPWSAFTSSAAAKAQNYSTYFGGKWHLGDFFQMNVDRTSPADKKWKYSHPGLFGFDEWLATKASASSSMLNCGCFNPIEGCVVGGGVVAPDGQSLECTNYWTHDPAHSIYPTGAANITTKEPGDDTAFLVSHFTDWLNGRKDKDVPFFAVLWVHTVHVPHPAMPEWYARAPFPSTNGDYLGTIMQMDAALGTLVGALKSTGNYDDTVLFYNSDNGPHDRNAANSRSASGVDATGNLVKLRQCKASTFEGGIRVPGFVHAPSLIKANRIIPDPVTVYDYLPTAMALMGYDKPAPFPLDGRSLLPALRGQHVPPAAFGILNPGPQMKGGTFVTSDLKLVYSPSQGQCEWVDGLYDHHNTHGKYFLFNITADPFETEDLMDKLPHEAAAAQKSFTAFFNSVLHSRQFESQCDP